MTWVLNKRDLAWQARIARCRRILLARLNAEDRLLRDWLRRVSRVNAEIRRREKERQK